MDLVFAFIVWLLSHVAWSIALKEERKTRVRQIIFFVYEFFLWFIVVIIATANFATLLICYLVGEIQLVKISNVDKEVKMSSIRAVFMKRWFLIIMMQVVYVIIDAIVFVSKL